MKYTTKNAKLPLKLTNIIFSQSVPVITLLIFWLLPWECSFSQKNVLKYRIYVLLFKISGQIRCGAWSGGIYTLKTMGSFFW